MGSSIEDIIDGGRKLKEARLVLAEHKRQVINGLRSIYNEMLKYQEMRRVAYIQSYTAEDSKTGDTSVIAAVRVTEQGYTCPTIQKEYATCKKAEEELSSILQTLETPKILKYTLFQGTRKEMVGVIESAKYVRTKYVDNMLKMNNCC